VLSGAVRKIKSSYGKNTIVMEFDGSNEFIKNFKGIKINDLSSNRVEFKLEDSNLTTNDILSVALQNNITIYKFEKVEPSLHEIFIEVVGAENLINKEALL
jgi:ABC-2 type transport system ATP-binding protein